MYSLQTILSYIGKNPNKKIPVCQNTEISTQSVLYQSQPDSVEPCLNLGKADSNIKQSLIFALNNVQKLFQEHYVFNSCS